MVELEESSLTEDGEISIKREKVSHMSQIDPVEALANSMHLPTLANIMFNKDELIIGFYTADRKGGQSSKVVFNQGRI